MVRAKLLYAALVISVAVFYVLYIDSFPLVVLVCLLLIPIILRTALFWLHMTSGSELCFRRGGCRVGESVPVTLLIESKCPFSFPRAEAELTVRHSFSRKCETVRMKFPLQARNVTRLTFYVTPDRCGIVEIRVKRLRAYDIFCLFRTNLRRTVDTTTLLVLPEPLSLPMQDGAPPVEQPDGERFSGKAGEDPSEVFAIREYRPGDQVSRMHWKLSSRSEELLVKDFSAPIRKNCLLYLEYHPVKDLLTAETLVKFSYSIAHALVGGGYICDIAWTDSRTGTVQLHKPETLEELDAAFAALYDCLYSLRTNADAARETFSAMPYSSATVLTNDPDPVLTGFLTEDLQANRRNLICIGQEPPALSGKDLALYCVDPAAPSLDLLIL